MRNFAKSVLNYFATYNETRFRFGKKLPYEWANDSTTLDLSVFPEFQHALLAAVQANTPFTFEVAPGQYRVQLDTGRFRQELLQILDSQFSGGYLAACVEDSRKQLGATGSTVSIQVDAHGQAVHQIPNADFEHRARMEGLRQFNLAFRREAGRILLELQRVKQEALAAELRFSSVPPSSFNPNRVEQRIFDQLQKLAVSSSEPLSFHTTVKVYINGEEFDLVMYDLFFVLRKFFQTIGTQSLYLFFHEMAGDDARFPLFCIEIDFRDQEQRLSIFGARNVLMLNTPALNNFEFDTILTTPRACRFEEAVDYLSQVERFLQAKYAVMEPFIMKPQFQTLHDDELPEISYRIGLQAVRNEDRKILDYSELITTLDGGAGRKFIDLVGSYIDGNVQNTVDEVQRSYRENYPHKSVNRLVHPHSQIPMNLSEAQKRILLAAENPKSRIIVVDGPPGTGKSYAITALIYQANLLGKSVLVTSHKQQALDVIDDFLTSQFKELHPRAKPPVLRLSSTQGPRSPNDLENTLSTPVINAATQRFMADNSEAVEKDRRRLFTEIQNANSEFWKGADAYPAHLQETFELVRLHADIFGTEPSTDVAFEKTVFERGFDVPRITRLAGLFAQFRFRLSLAALVAISERRQEIAAALKTCERLHEMARALPPEFLKIGHPVPESIGGFAALLRELTSACRDDAFLGQCAGDPAEECRGALFSAPDIKTFDDLCMARDTLQTVVTHKRKLCGRLFKKKEIAERQKELALRFPSVAKLFGETTVEDAANRYQAAIDRIEEAVRRFPWLRQDYWVHGHTRLPPERLKVLLAGIRNLEYHGVLDLLAVIAGRDVGQMTFAEIAKTADGLQRLREYRILSSELASFAVLCGLTTADPPALYAFLKEVNVLFDNLDDADIILLNKIVEGYGPLLELAGFSPDNVQTLASLAEGRGRTAQILRYMELHVRLSQSPEFFPPSRETIADFYAKTHKLLDHHLDERFKNLQNHAGDVQKILIAIKSGKRISIDQARVLFSNLSCVIADPSLISRHFPMTEDLVDYLIIDEASQVSIAESISLMLRARQTIVFGDELQYGAVGAINVSERYAEQYFKDILRDYALDMNDAVTDEERDRIARDAARNPSEEDEESSRMYTMDPGTKEWLKTFSVRTSTLSFAKALKNYSDSLNVHFRSFPEIIGYSNDFFYRESQIDLVPNRIRTKPISEVLRFLRVETRGDSGRNVNLDEIEAVKADLERLHAAGYRGTIGVICSFREQTARMEELLRKELPFSTELERNQRFKVWFVGDVQGEERDIVYYSFVQDKRRGNADLRTIYPIIGGTADNIRRLKMQRLNVGFSRAKDTMVFVHSMPLEDYCDTRLGDALKHYLKELNTARDNYVRDGTVFGSPAERALYVLITQTPFYQSNKNRCSLIAQFEIGKYLRQEYHRYIPKYRVDFLMTLGDSGKEKSLIIEYDGVEFHTRNPDLVTAHNFDQEYLEYDNQRQLELESYGYAFLRINKFSLLPRRKGETPIEVLNGMLEKALA